MVNGSDVSYTTVKAFVMSEVKQLSNPWKGRTTTEKQAYWYQQVQQKERIDESFDLNRTYAIVGYAVDEGVRRNLGRIGAALGPQKIRERLAKEPLHIQDEINIVDLGDVSCVENDLEQAQSLLANKVEHIHERGAMSIVLGGGHDVAWGHYQGLKKAYPNKRIGIINFDAHLDTRPIIDKANSGTPFWQVAQQAKLDNQPFDYLCIGAQLQGNTTQLFQSSIDLGANILFLEECFNIQEVVQEFVNQVDLVYVTVDLDGFPSYLSPGVSAPAVEGLSYIDVISGIRTIAEEGKLVALDVAECNPTYDIDNRTARLAARIISQTVAAVEVQLNF